MLLDTIVLKDKLLKLVQKYDRPGPRYTSYPTAPHWTSLGSSSFKKKDFQKKLFPLNGKEKKSFALYTHIPFCEQKCYFCACNVVITRKKEIADIYLEYLKKEMRLMCESFCSFFPVTQIHWGGGTPTYLNEKQIEELFREYQKYFSIAPQAEISIEIDPRVTTFEQLKLLRSLGFNRISMGVQDFDSKVQASIHRNQTEEETQRTHEYCRKLGFESINMDFVYGLAFQTLLSFEKNVRTIVKLNPDRIAFYNYAHVPWLVSYQKLIPESALPRAELKLDLFCSALRIFDEAGYVSIGMDHFAKSSDELVKARHTRTLRRNFMGYTTQKDSTLLAFGVSSISEIEDLYMQNFRKLSDYYKALDENRWPVMRGYVLSHDDQLRRHVIMELMCNLRLDILDAERRFSISFFEYFSKELLGLKEMTEEGLIEINQNTIQITPLGKIFIRNICMVFDRYLNTLLGQEEKRSEHKQYSKTL